MTMAKHRIPASERRQALLTVVRDLFAQKGFDGVTTRELAKAAGVPQSLLYKHFPSKESFFTAMSDECLKGADGESYKKVLSLPSSTSTLILITHFAMSKILAAPEDQKAMDLLITRSLIEDGEFFLSVQKQLLAPWYAKFDQSLKAAVKAGDAVATPSGGDAAPFLAYAAGIGIGLFIRPRRRVVDLDLSRDQILENCVWFVLLGVGVKADVIRRQYNPSALTLMART